MHSRIITRCAIDYHTPFVNNADRFYKNVPNALKALIFMFRVRIGSLPTVDQELVIALKLDEAIATKTPINRQWVTDLFNYVGGMRNEV